MLSSSDVDQFLGLVGSLPGDANLDGKVDFDDFLVVSELFGRHTRGLWSRGDFDCNGHTQFADFLILSANFSENRVAAAVPEPSMHDAWMIAISLIAFRSQRTRHLQQQVTKSI